MSKIVFYATWININGRVKYDQIKLKIDEDMKAIWKTYHRRLTKGPTKFDATISKSIDDIINMLCHLESPVSV